MSAILAITRTAEKIINYVNDQVHETKCDDIEDVFPMLKMIQNMFPEWVIHACPIKHPNIRFVTDNCKDVFGYPKQHFFEAKSAFAGSSFYHEDDVDEIHRCFLFIENFLKETPPSEYSGLRFVFQYRARHLRGHYLTVRDEKATIRINDSVTLFYTLLKDISSETVFSGVKLAIFNMEPTLKKIAEYKPADQHSKLSKRENELLTMIRKGLTSKEIAYMLQISQHTVRNIRQNMFAKYKVNNSIELLNRTRELV